MKKISKLLALLLALAMLLSLAACGGSDDAKSDSDNTASDTTDNTNDTADTTGYDADDAAADTGDTDAEPAGDGETYLVGICQLAPHVALDAATQGFKDALTEEFGDAVKFDEQNAAGDSATCGTIVNGFVSEGVDLMLANATASLQAAASATGDIPVLGTAVTEYGVALGISGFDGLVGTNVSGTSDLAPLDQQAQMIRDWCPDAETVGLLYCSAEANSQYQVDTIQTYLEELGFTCTQYPFSDTNDMASVTQSAADACDVIYVPTDNTVANNTGIVDNICNGKVPVFAGEEGICGGCGVATLSISYYDLGVTTGKMAAKILKGEANVSEMPIEYAPEVTKKYNPTTCEALGITPPDGYEAISAE